MQINELPADEIAKIRAKVKPLIAKFGGEFSDTITELNAEIAKARK
jgi:hypothetical protein